MITIRELLNQSNDTCYLKLIFTRTKKNSLSLIIFNLFVEAISQNLWKNSVSSTIGPYCYKKKIRVNAL